MQAYIMYMMPNLIFQCSKGGVIMRKIIPFQSNHCLGHLSFIRPDDVNNQLIVRDYMPMKTLQVLSYIALYKQMYILGKGFTMLD